MPNVPPGTERVKEGIAGSMTTMRLKPSILCLAKFLLPPYNILIIKYLWTKATFNLHF